MEVPVEILLSIFLLTLRNTNAKHPSDFDPPYSTPLYISHVCRRWRQVSLSFRELWSYFAFCFTDSIGSSERKFVLKLFDTCLQRTNGCSLNFRFSCEVYKGDIRTAADHIIQTLLSQQRRWKDVRLYWRSLVSEDYPAIDLNDMPSLISLFLDVQFCRADSFLVPPVHLNITRSLLLESLEINGGWDLEFDPEATFASLRLSNIEFLGRRWEKGNAARLCFDLLKASPRLKVFDARFGKIGASRSISPLSGEDTYATHNVRRLTLWDGIDSAYVIEKLTVPDLVYLQYDEEDHENGTEILSCFFQRSLPPLQSLRLNRSCAQEAIVVPLLRILPKLQELRMLRPEVSAWFFEELTHGVNPSKSDDPPLCPALRSLHLEEIYVSGSANECAEALYSMALSRETHLKTFRGVWFTRGPGAVDTFELGLYMKELAKSLGHYLIKENEILITDDVEQVLSKEDEGSDD